MLKHRYHLTPLLLIIALLINLTIVPAALATPIDEVRNLLNKIYVDELAPETLSGSSIDQILNNVGDPYTNYLTPEQYEDLQSSLTDKSISGIGVYFEPCPEGIVILQVVPNSPAQAAGLKKGDIITHADYKPLAGLPTETSISLITGPEKTQVTLTVTQDQKPSNYTITRQQLIISSVNNEIIDQHIGYLKLDNFGTDTNAHMLKTFTSPDYKSVDHWIIDVRANPGGYLETVLETAGFFIGSNISLLVKDRANNTRGASSRSATQLVDKPVFLLADESSASAAEILTATLKDYKSALIIGRQTFGKGSVQTMVSLSDGGILKITISKFFSPRGNTINKVGVLPHLVIKKADPQLVARLLSSSASANDKTGYLSVRLVGHTYEINIEQALSPEYKAAFTELLWALPPEAVAMQGDKNGWSYTTINDLAQNYHLGNNPRSFIDTRGAQKNELNQLASRLLVSGYPDGTFAPDKTITRAELAAMVASTTGIKLQPKQNSFTDVPANSWYASSVTTLKQAGIITGFQGKYHPEQTATQEEVITMVTRTHQYLTSALRTTVEAKSSTSYLKQVSPWAKDAVSYAVELGLVDTRSLSRKAATRAETATMLTLILQKAGII